MTWVRIVQVHLYTDFFSINIAGLCVCRVLHPQIQITTDRKQYTFAFPAADSQP